MAGKKDIVEQALKLVMGGGDEAAKTGIKAYHVSPHDFDKFEWSPRTSKTGEGNQSYGAGLYFAENPSVSGRGGDYWRQFFNKMKSGPERTAAGAMFANKFELEKAINALESGSKYHVDRAIPGRYGDGPEIELGHKLLADETQQALDILRGGQIAGPRTYEVDINADPESFLDWDKPLHSQSGLIDRLSRSRSPNVQRVLSNPKLMSPYRESYGVDIGPMTGEDLFKGIALNQTGIPTGTSKTSSLFLQSEIPGIKYLDAGSRGAGDGTRNYVIFDDKLIDIKDKYADGGEVREGYAGKGAVTDPYADEVAKAKSLMAEKQYDDQSWGDWAGDAVGNALNTAKSVLPTALGGRGEVGISDMARGAYEGAKDAVTFPGDVITGKQPLYDESGRPLEGAVGRSFNTVGAVGGASSVVPVPSNSLRVFGGTKSLTADKNALSKAQIMEGNGEDAETIRQATGWRRGAEGRWRYEISDAGTATDKGKWITDTSSTTNGVYAKLGDYFDHPELYAAYPEFKNMVVKGYYGNGPEYGYYKPRYDKSGTIAEPYIGLNLNYLTSNQTRNTLLHEIQHAIQQKEGFVNGANPLNFSPDTIPNPDVAIYEDALIHNPVMKEYKATIGSPDWQDAIDKSNKFFDKAYRHRFKEIEDLEDKTGKDMGSHYKALSQEYEAEIDKMYPIFARVKELGRELQKAGIPPAMPYRKFLTPHEAYERTAGEVEARNVQHRKDWTPEQRAKTSPESTQEYVNDAQYIDWNNTSWRKGYSVGGASDSDRDIESAMMIAGAR